MNSRAARELRSRSARPLGQPLPTYACCRHTGRTRHPFWSISSIVIPRTSKRASLTPNCGVRTALVSSSSKKNLKTCDFLYDGTPMVMILKALEIMTGYTGRSARTPASSSPRDTHRIASAGCRDRVASPAAQQWESDGRRVGGVHPGCVCREARRALYLWAGHRDRTGGSQRRWSAPIRNRHSATPRAGSRGPAVGGGPHRIRGHGWSHDVRHVHVAARDGVVRKDRRE